MTSTAATPVPAASAAASAAAAPAAATSAGRQVWVWFRHHNRTMWRTPIATFFTIVMPLVMMVVLSTFLDGSFSHGGGSEIEFHNYYVPAMAVFSAASATYTSLCISMALQREQGILKRVRGTPLAAWKFFASSVLSAIWVAFLGAALLFTVGIVAFDASLQLSQLGWLAAFFVAGVSACALLGMAASNLASTGQAGSAIANATMLPLAFISGLFIPANEIPLAVDIIGDVFPLKAFGEGLRAGFDPGLSVDKLWNLLKLVAWGVAGLFFMLRCFHWVPKAERK